MILILFTLFKPEGVIPIVTFFFCGDNPDSYICVSIQINWLPHRSLNQFRNLRSNNVSFRLRGKEFPPFVNSKIKSVTTNSNTPPSVVLKGVLKFYWSTN
jgi:hypothetical protein